MNRVAIGAVCVAVCLFSFAAKEARRVRQVLAAFALEKLERIFDVVEKVINPA